jgi:hypothetical protein
MKLAGSPNNHVVELENPKATFPPRFRLQKIGKSDLVDVNDHDH